MNKLLTVMIISLTTSTVLAAYIPEKVMIRSKRGNVVFPHRKHADAGLLKDCKFCHTADDMFKINTYGMENGHNLCVDCHTKMKKGPTLCMDCHGM